MDGFKWRVGILTNHTLRLEGKPSQSGKYLFVIKCGKNKVDETVRTDTIVINFYDPTAIDMVETGQGNWVELASATVTNSLSFDLSMKQRGNVSVRLFNTAGTQVLEQELNAATTGHHNIGGLDNLNSGVYLLTIKSAEGTYSQKIVKR